MKRLSLMRNDPRIALDDDLPATEAEAEPGEDSSMPDASGVGLEALFSWALPRRRHSARDVEAVSPDVW